MNWWMSCGSEIQLWGKTVKIYCWPAIWKQLASDKSYGQGSDICCIPSSKGSNSLDTWCKEPTHWKRPWCRERLKAGGEGDFRGRDGWMASLTQRTWVWGIFRRGWRTGKPCVLQSMGSQRVRHNWATSNNLVVTVFDIIVHIFLFCTSLNCFLCV